MFRGKFFVAYLFVVPLIFAAVPVFAQQEAQKVTITVGEASKDKFTLEPREMTVRAGKIEFTLVNKGAENHNLRIKQGDKEIARLVRVAEPGKSEKSAPVELTAGEYEILCTYTSGGSHKDKGMAGKLIVK